VVGEIRTSVFGFFFNLSAGDLRFIYYLTITKKRGVAAPLFVSRRINAW
jgi:hypothetical protein